MCGFAGTTSSYEELKKMSIGLKKRAIDTEYYFSDYGFFLYHAHLKITDLKKQTSQPYVTGKYIISFVGEIYNTSFLCKYFQFSSELSEIQLIGELYAKIGEGFVNFLNGEFAICIFDKENSCLFLYRDRYGTKPLYYTIYKENIYFSSEISSLIRDDTKLSTHNLYYHAIFGYGIHPYTLIDGVYSIPAGSYISYSKNSVLKERTFSVYKAISNQDFISTLEESIIRKIPLDQKKVFISLSGGLDSTIILHYLKKHFNGNIIAYSIKSQKNNEDIETAIKNSNKLGIEHHFIEECNLSYDAIHHEGLMNIPNIYEEVRKIKNHTDIKVEFGGDGKEELFKTNTNFDLKRIILYYRYFRLKKNIKELSINLEFLNLSMLDYNLQIIDKMTLRNGIERRLPFLDYELIRFKNYKNFEKDIKNVLDDNGLEYQKKKYAYSDGFQYNHSQKDYIQLASYIIEQLKINGK